MATQTAGRGDFRTDREKARWLGTELDRTDPTRLDPMLAGVVASGGLSKAEAKKLQKANEKAMREQYLKLQKGLSKTLSTLSADQQDAILSEVGKVVTKEVAKGRRITESDKAKDERTLNQSRSRKEEKQAQEAWRKSQAAHVLALSKTLEQLQKELKYAEADGKKAEVKRLNTLHGQYASLMSMYKETDEKAGTRSHRDKIKTLEQENEKLLGALGNANSAERLTETLESTLDRANTIQTKLEDRYKKRETQLLEMQKNIKDFRTDFKRKLLGRVGIGAFNLQNALDLKDKVKGKIQSARKLVNDYRDLRHFRKTGKVRGYAQSIGADGTPAMPEAATAGGTETSSQTTYKQKLLGEVRNLVRAVRKNKPQSQQASSTSGPSKFLAALQESLGKMVAGIGATLASFGSSLVKVAGPALALAAAGAVGYKIGQWLNEQPWFKNTVGKGLSKAVNFAGKLVTGRDIDAEAKADSERTKEQMYKEANEMRRKQGKAPIAMPSSTSVPPPTPSNAGSDARQAVAATVTPVSTPPAQVEVASPVTPPASAAPSPVTTGGTMESQRGKLFRTNGQVDVTGVNGAVQQNFLGMAQEYKDKTGKLIGVNSAYRPSDQQRKLYEENKKSGSPKKVAPPGSSLHEFGYALDVQSADGNRLDSMGLLSKFGFSRPVKGEPWHVQPTGITKAAAQQGIYSADYASNQGGVASIAKGGNTEATTESFSPPPATSSETSVASAESSGGKGGGRAGGAGSAIGVNDIPLFSSVDGSLLAMNVGAIGGG